MSFIKIKSGVIVPKVVVIACAVVNAANALDIEQDIVVTSGNDSKHKKGSRHYSDEALDFRTKTLTKEQKHELTTATRARLGLDYDVVLESEGKVNEHLHVEFDPK